METLVFIIAGGLLMSAIAMVGGVTIVLQPETLDRLILPLVALAAGKLLGGAFFHMVPEGAKALDLLTAGGWLVAVALFRTIPSGVGSRRKDLKLDQNELKRVLTSGVAWSLENGYGAPEDQAHTEANGCISNADPGKISNRALERGKAQLGTLGSGNHFLEVGFVEEVYDTETASVMGLEKDQATVLIRTGSRGLGHQICDDYIFVMLQASKRYGIDLPDRQLCCAPVDSKEGKEYLGAMAGAANFAFVNRQMIMHWSRETFGRVFQKRIEDLQVELVYDVCHNIAKMETHQVEGTNSSLCVHRKGATRAFPPGHPDIPEKYRSIGQPVLVPGDMGRYSFVLAGTAAGYRETFGSACHGAGRILSRGQAKKAAKGRAVARELEDKGIIVKGASKRTLSEEISDAYKDVDNVINVLHQAGISKKVVKIAPLLVIKGSNGKVPLY
jgi:tRNA-splicing ligase RtcB